MKLFLVFLMVFYYTLKIVQWFNAPSTNNKLTDNNSIKPINILPDVGVRHDQKTHELYERITVTTY